MSWRLSGQFPGVETMSYTGCRGGAEEGGRGGGGGSITVWINAGYYLDSARKN